MAALVLLPSRQFHILFRCMGDASSKRRYVCENLFRTRSWYAWVVLSVAMLAIRISSEVLRKCFVSYFRKAKKPWMLATGSGSLRTPETWRPMRLFYSLEALQGFTTW